MSKPFTRYKKAELLEIASKFNVELAEGDTNFEIASKLKQAGVTPDQAEELFEVESKEDYVGEEEANAVNFDVDQDEDDQESANAESLALAEDQETQESEETTVVTTPEATTGELDVQDSAPVEEQVEEAVVEDVKPTEEVVVEESHEPVKDVTPATEELEDTGPVQGDVEEPVVESEPVVEEPETPAPVAFVEPAEEPSKPVEQAPVVEEDEEEAPADDLVLIRMTRHNYSYEVRGYKFTREHPFGLVTEEDADYLVEVEGGFQMATPSEARSFYN